MGDVSDSPSPIERGTREEIRWLLQDLHRRAKRIEASHEKLCETVSGPDGEPQKGMCWKVEKLLEDREHRERIRTESRTLIWSVLGTSISALVLAGWAWVKTQVKSGN